MTARQLFEARVLPHLDAAYNLARWLLRNEQAAEDAVQEASMRAFRYIGSLRGDDPRPWLLGIVELDHVRPVALALEHGEAGVAHDAQ